MFALALAVPIGLLWESWKNGDGLLFFLSFLRHYFLISFLLEQFIFRKIKLIYKFICKPRPLKGRAFINIYCLKGLEVGKMWAQASEKKRNRLASHQWTIQKNFCKTFPMNLKPHLFIQDMLTPAARRPENPSVNRRFRKSSSNVERLTNLLNAWMKYRNWKEANCI